MPSANPILFITRVHAGSSGHGASQRAMHLARLSLWDQICFQSTVSASA